MKYKKAAFTAVQILVTLGILYIVFHSPEKRARMREALGNSDKIWLVGGFFAYGFVELFAAVRWNILLRVQGINLSPLRLTALLMIGIFFNLFLPGGTGGDVVKTFYLLKETPGKNVQALLAVLIDRVVGLLGLMVVTIIMMGLRYKWLAAFPITAGLTNFLLGLLIVALAGILFSFAVTGFNLVQKLPHRMPFRDKFVELSVAYNLYASAWKASLVAFIFSIGVHIGSFAVFYFSGRAFRATASLLDFFAIMPIVNTITSLPISVAGVGVREKLFEELLGNLCHVPDPVAVLVSTSGFLVLAAWGVIGGIIYILYRPSEHAKLAQISEEVTHLEEEITRGADPADYNRDREKQDSGKRR